MSSPAHSVRVNLAERSYDIAIGRGLLATCGQLLLERLAARHAVVITDDRVRAPHADAVLAALATVGIHGDLLVVPAGESTKCLAEAEKLWNRLVELRADPKPTYSIDGQTVSWTAYLRSLEETVEWCNAQLRGLEPAEVESRACT